MTEKFDIAVIGGGPGGYSAAIKAGQLGAKVVIFEGDALGGTCLNRGCVPTKALLEKAHFVEDVRKYTENGFVRDAGFFSWKKAIAQKQAVTKQLSGGVGAILKSYGIEIVNENAIFDELGKVKTASGKTYETKNVIIATGSKSALPPVEGLKLGGRIIDSTGALELPKIPKELVILGGGVIGVEFASVYATFGTKVTIIEFLPGILYNEDRETVSALAKELRKKGIEINTNSKVVAAKDDGDKVSVTYECDGEKVTVSGDYLLVAAGRRPDLTGIDAEKLGLELSKKGYINVDNTLKTNLKGVYAVGDITGQIQLAYTAYAQAEMAAENCMGAKKTLAIDLLPTCIFSLPQYAAVGLTEEKAKEQSIQYTKGVFPYSASGKALAMGEKVGFVKTLVNEADGTIIGCHIVGNTAPELIHTMQMAIAGKFTVDQMEGLLFSHPTLSEMLKESVLAAHKKAIHLTKQ